MTRAELINLLANKVPEVPIKTMEEAVKHIFEQMSVALENGTRVEIRGFASFSLRYRGQRTARNPKTGDTVVTEGKFTPHFKAGKELRERVNDAMSGH